LTREYAGRPHANGRRRQEMGPIMTVLVAIAVVGLVLWFLRRT
jgi:hypothetical protein